MSKYSEQIEKQLPRYLENTDENIKTVFDAMQYSLMAGGKRIRPVLALQFAELCGGSAEAAMPFACAVEMIHTYSLIHDDLPCMDNDDLRRGKPTNHKVYGEANALLAGDGLMTLAFQTLLSDEALRLNSAEKCVMAGKTLSECAGAVGMIGGQIIDLASENQTVTVDRLKIMDEKKTGALIKAACVLGCISAGATVEQMQAAEQYAYNIGLAFQIVDDILDVTSDTATLGKPIGSDAENQKSTYVSLLGIEECRRLVNELTDKAVESLGVFDNDTTELKKLAIYLRDRNK